MPRTVVLAILIAAVSAAAGCAGQTTESPEQVAAPSSQPANVFEAAGVDVKNSAYEIVDSVSSDAIIVTLKEPITDRKADAFAALLADLGFNVDVFLAKASNTRAIDGMQTAVGDHANATWTYHPDDGLLVIFERVTS